MVNKRLTLASGSWHWQGAEAVTDIISVIAEIG